VSVKILYFAGLKETLGLAGETVVLPAGVASVGALRDWLAANGRAALITTKNLRCAVNQNIARLDTPVGEGDEIAFFPPVTGG